MCTCTMCVCAQVSSSSGVIGYEVEWSGDAELPSLTLPHYQTQSDTINVSFLPMYISTKFSL